MPVRKMNKEGCKGFHIACGLPCFGLNDSEVSK